MKEPWLNNLEPFFESGDIKFGDKATSDRFNDYIVENYPWAVMYITWETVSGAESFKLTATNHEAAEKFINASRVGSYLNIGMVYSASKEYLIMKRQFLIDNLDLLTSFVNYLCYFIGINDDGELVFDDFVEYKASNGWWLSGKMPPSS